MNDNDLHASPLVTIGLPFSCESAKHFRLAVQSVFAQTYDNWELLLIADGAAAELLALAQEIDDPRVRLLKDGVRKGLPTRLNQLAHEADGEFLARMDSDDIMHPERIEASVAAILNNPSCDIVSTQVMQIDEEGQLLGKYRHPRLTEDRTSMFKVSPIVHPTVMTRLRWSLEHPYDENYLKAQDKELWIRAVTARNHLQVPRELLFYRVSRQLDSKKHALASKYDRRIIRFHGPAQLGGFPSRLLVVRSHVKQAVFSVLLRSGRADALYRRRYEPVTDATSASAALELVKNTSIPFSDSTASWSTSAGTSHAAPQSSGQGQNR